MIHRFGEFELDHARFELRGGGTVIPIEPRVFDLISYLVQNADRVVSKAELFEHVWEGRAVVDGALTVAVAAARRALNDDFSHQRVIRTCAGRGYQFVMECRAESPPQVDRDWKRSSDFLGRDAELHRLEACFGHLTDSRLSTVIVSGEPGIGKTRLLDEFLGLAKSRGIHSYTGRCPESERTPSLWPWAQILNRLAASAPSTALAALPERHRASLATLLPDSFADPGVTHIDNPDIERFRLFEAIAAALRTFLGPSPSILAIEDLHRSDDATLRFLQFAIQELHDAPLLVAATLRPGETQSSVIHSNTVSALSRHPRSLHLELQGLGVEDTHKLAQTLTARPVSEKHAADIFRHTAGNPFFVRQLVTLLESGWLQEPSGPPQMPATISNAILGHTASLSSRTQQLLRTAAVIGREFSANILGAATGEERASVAEALDEAIRASIVRPGLEGSDRFSFVHVLVRDALDSQLNLNERQQLHLRIGLALDVPTADISDRTPGEAAHHLSESAAAYVMPRVLELSQTAGDLATRRSAHEDAAHHYARALEALQLAAPGDPSRHCHLLLLRGEALCRAGDRATARDTLRAAASVARALGATTDLARAALAVAPGFLAAEGGVADPSLEHLLIEALECLDPSDRSTRALVAARLAMALHWTERETRMHEMLRLAQEAAGMTSEPAVALQVKFAEWFCEWNHKSFDRRCELAETIQALAEEARDPEMTLVGMVLRMVGMLERGDLAHFDNTLIGFSGLAQQLRSPQSLWYCSMYKGVRALIDGRLDEARASHAEFSDIASKVGDANAFHSLVAQTALLRWEEGALESMIPGLELAALRFPSIRAFRAGLAWSYAQLGRLNDAAREISVIGRGGFLDVPQRFDWSAAISFSADACATMGDPHRSKVLYELLQPYSGRFLVVGLGVACLGAADRVLGLLASAFGRPDQAQWHLERAVSLTTSAGMRVWNIRAKLDLADFLRRHQGSRARGSVERLASEALEAARSTSLLVLRERAESLIHQRQ